ncbi:MAG: hypothetical protein JRC86_10975 [Deltaproteobacteria bacterium]|nr:hypothetical protein [Deltaproteobacteria bacterium]
MVARGVTPVINLDSGHPDVQAARMLLNSHKQLVLGRAWWFNTETVTIYPDDVGICKVPIGTIGLDNDDNNIIMRGNLYNMVERSDIFTEAVEDLGVMLDRAWEDMPVQPIDYIISLAKEEFIRPLESQILSAQAEKDVSRAKSLLDIADLRYKDVGKQSGNPLMLKWRGKMLVR